MAKAKRKTVHAHIKNHDGPHSIQAIVGDTIEFDNDDRANYVVTVRDSTGAVVAKVPLPPNGLGALSGLAKGTYSYEIDDAKDAARPATHVIVITSSGTAVKKRKKTKKKKKRPAPRS